jgi:RNA polymerase sigma-70 factor (ECF subfamily)
MVSNEPRAKLLFAKGLAGSSDAYREFLSAMSGLLRRYVKRQLAHVGRPEQEAEDIVQEALMAIHAKRHTYSSEVPVTAWAYAIARYKLIDYLRATNHESRLLPLDSVDSDVDSTTRIEAAIDLGKIVTTLSKSQHDAIVLMKLEGLTAKEAAKCTGSSETMIRVNVSRGLKKLARVFRAKAGRVLK